MLYQNIVLTCIVIKIINIWHGVIVDIAYVFSFFPLALQMMKDNIDIRLTLSSLLIDDDKTDEATTLLSPPKSPGIVITKLFYASNLHIFSVFL